VVRHQAAKPAPTISWIAWWATIGTATKAAPGAWANRIAASGAPIAKVFCPPQIAAAMRCGGGSLIQRARP